MKSTSILARFPPRTRVGAGGRGSAFACGVGFGDGGATYGASITAARSAALRRRNHQKIPPNSIIAPAANGVKDDQPLSDPLSGAISVGAASMAAVLVSATSGEVSGAGGWSARAGLAGATWGAFVAGRLGTAVVRGLLRGGNGRTSCGALVLAAGGLAGVATGAAGCGIIGRLSCGRAAAEGGAISPSGGPCTRDGAGAGAGAGAGVGAGWAAAASCAHAVVGAHVSNAAAAMAFRGILRRWGTGKDRLSLRGVWPP